MAEYLINSRGIINDSRSPLTIFRHNGRLCGILKIAAVSILSPLGLHWPTSTRLFSWGGWEASAIILDVKMKAFVNSLVLRVSTRRGNIPFQCVYRINQTVYFLCSSPCLHYEKRETGHTLLRPKGKCSCQWCFQVHGRNHCSCCK